MPLVKVGPQHAYHGEPYSPYVHPRVKYSQTANPGTQMVNLGMTYPQGFPQFAFPQVSTLITPQTPQSKQTA